jgi:hypothetical protein
MSLNRSAEYKHLPNNAVNLKAFMDEIKVAIPESQYYAKEAPKPIEQVQVKQQPSLFPELTQEEQQKSFNGLFCFKALMEKDYKWFTQAQVEADKPLLDEKSFLQMRDFVVSKLGGEPSPSTVNEYAAITWSVLCNRLGRLRFIQNECKEKNIGFAKVLSEVLKANNTENEKSLFPGFLKLSKEHRDGIIASCASGCDLSLFEECEQSPVKITNLAKLDANTLNHYMVRTIFDVSSSAAHKNPNGSVTMHQETWALFNDLFTALSEHPANPDVGYQKYIISRADRIGVPRDAKTEERIALGRIAGQLRYFNPEQARDLLAVWNDTNRLSAAEREILTREFSVHGGEGTRAIFVAWGGKMLLNAQVGRTALGGLTVGLKMMSRVFELARSQITAPSSEVFVAAGDKVAEIIGDNNILNMDLRMDNNDGRRMNISVVRRNELTSTTTPAVNQPRL